MVEKYKPKFNHMIKVKQTYQMPDITAMQICFDSICATSFDAGSQNEQFNQGNEFAEFGW